MGIVTVDWSLSTTCSRRFTRAFRAAEERRVKITDVEAFVVLWPPPERPHFGALRRAGHGNELVVRLHTDEGHVGLGEAHALQEPMHPLFVEAEDGRMHPSGAARAVVDVMKPILLGEDPTDHERLWGALFGLTHRKGWLDHGHSRHELLCALAGVDIALWDLKGKAAGLPVYRLLGGIRDSVPCYVTGGYYREGKTNADLVRECEGYAEQGYRAIKLKAGGLAVEEDVARVRAVREALGDDVDLMVDFNEAHDVPTAVRAAKLLEPLAPRWIEEPVHWYDCVEGLAQVAAATSIPIASGERALHRWEARDLVLRGGIKVMQFDCTRAAGVTEFLKIAALCATQNVSLAPHHDPQIHGHLIAALPGGEEYWRAQGIDGRATGGARFSGRLRSVGRRQGRALPWPMTPFSATAAACPSASKSAHSMSRFISMIFCARSTSQ
jgi:L-alanine-DL-glutamate epimerase-like enolase superfamily enzyme